MVTTASATPRTRSADTAVTSPSTTAAAIPASGASDATSQPHISTSALAETRVIAGIGRCSSSFSAPE